jgi:flavin reductase (DIM6/NTAB) family NADH-FMN oxidoreductase RutF
MPDPAGAGAPARHSRVRITIIHRAAMDPERIINLDVEKPVWERVFIVAPLVIIGTREGDGYDLAPKHMAAPMGWGNYFGFVCAPSHSTYHNARGAGAFTVSYPRPDQVTAASLAASGRQPGPGPSKPVLRDLPTTPARKVDGVFLSGSYFMLECEVHEVVDGLGDNSLIIGRVVAAAARAGALRLTDDDHQQAIYDAPLLAYVHPGRYAIVQKTQSFPFPADFSR